MTGFSKARLEEDKNSKFIKSSTNREKQQALVVAVKILEELGYQNEEEDTSSINR